MVTALMVQGSARIFVGCGGDATLMRWYDRWDVFVRFSQSKILGMILWDFETIVHGFDMVASNLGMGETWGTFGPEITL